MTLAMNHRVGRLSWGPNIARDPNSFMGRFGGGWNWRLGIQFGKRSPDGSVNGILSLGSREHRIRWAGRRATTRDSTREN